MGLVSPWTTLPTLNNTFWQRIDYLLNSAPANGITVFLVLTMQCDMGMDAFAGTGVFNGVVRGERCRPRARTSPPGTPPSRT